LSKNLEREQVYLAPILNQESAKRSCLK